MLTMLLAARDEDGQPMTDRELRDELVTLLVAGHETTASALSWGFEQLLRAPDVLERVTARRARGRQRLPRGDGQGDPAPAARAADRAAAPDQAADRDRRARRTPPARPSPPASTSSTTTSASTPSPTRSAPSASSTASPASSAGSRSAAACAAASAPRSRSSRCGSRCARSSSALEVTSALDGPRGHRPPLDHAEPAARDADLRAPARARAESPPERSPQVSARASLPVVCDASAESSAWLASPFRFDTRRLRQGPQPGRLPDLPRGRGPAAIILRVSRWTCVLAGLALVPSACGSEQQDGEDPAAAEAPRRRPPPTPSDAGRRRRRRRHPRLDRRAAPRPRRARASRYFALPSVVSNGTPPIRLTSRADVRFFNRTLPCGATFSRRSTRARSWSPRSC